MNSLSQEKMSSTAFTENVYRTSEDKKKSRNQIIIRDVVRILQINEVVLMILTETWCEEKQIIKNGYIHHAGLPVLGKSISSS